MADPLHLPNSDARLLLDASLWMGVPENERTELQGAMRLRDAAAAEAHRGASWEAAHAADTLVRRAFSQLYARVAADAGLPSGELTDAQTQHFMVRLLCSDGDVSASERGLATKSAIAAVSAMRSVEATHKRRATTRLALIVLASMRRTMRNTSGALAFDNTLCMHRAVGAVFSTPDVEGNARRVRVVASILQGGSFESVWDHLRSYEVRMNDT